MEKLINVLITEEKSDFEKEYGKPDSFGINAEFCKKDGTLLIEQIKQKKPDVVIMDMFMSSMDSVAVLRTLEKEYLL